MVAIDPSGSLKHFPMPMQRFGVNPFGDNLYRIVLAHSRRSLVCGQWNGAGSPRAQWARTYPQFGPGDWIMEKWVDAFTFAGCTKTMWDYGDTQILGPYPERGEYVMCGNTAFDPMQTNIEKLIGLINAGSKFSWAEKLNACRKAADDIETEKKHLREAIILDALPAFGGGTFSAYGGGGGEKKSKVVRDIREVNRMRRRAGLRALPTPKGIPGQATTGGARVKQQQQEFAVPVTV